MPVGFEFADLAGNLGPGSTDRLGRVMFVGTLAAGSSLTLPWLNYDMTNLTTVANSNGVVYFQSFPFRIYHNVADAGILSWNNTTKVMTAIGAPRNLFIMGFRGTPLTPGEAGIVITNDNNEVIIDNVNPNLEVILESTYFCPDLAVMILPVEASDPNNFVLFKVPIGVNIIRGGGRIFSVSPASNISFVIARVNNVYSCISGGPPGLCLTRGTDGLVVFDSKRKYLRTQSIIQLEQYSLSEGGATGNSFFQHLTPFPDLSAFRIDTSYNWGTRIHAMRRLSTTLWTSYNFDRNDVGLNGAWQTAMSLINVANYPGAYLPVTLVAKP